MSCRSEPSTCLVGGRTYAFTPFKVHLRICHQVDGARQQYSWGVIDDNGMQGTLDKAIGGVVVGNSNASSFAGVIVETVLGSNARILC